MRIEAGKSYGAAARPAAEDEWGIVKVSSMTYGSFRPTENKALPGGSCPPAHLEIHEGDLLMSRANTREHVGAVVMVGACRRRLVLSDKSLRLHPTSDVDARWLLYALRSPAARSYLSTASSGVKDGMHNISQAALRAMPLEVPPLIEQRRIVEHLEEHLSRVEAAKSLVQAARGRLVQLRLAELRRWRTESLEVDPDGLRPLWQLAETSLGKMLDAKKSSGVHTPYLRNINVRWGRVETSAVATVPLSEGERTKFALQRGDLLVCEGGEPGRSAIWDSDEPMTYQKALHRVRVRAGAAVEPRFLQLMLEEVIRSGRAALMFTGTTIKHLPQEKLRQICLPVPPPAVQNRILAEAQAAESAGARLNDALLQMARRGDLLRCSLLAAAATGRLVEGSAAAIEAARV